MSDISRRSFVSAATAAAAAYAGLVAIARGQPATTRATTDGTWLLFTKSSGFEHDVIKRSGEAPSFLAKHLSPIFSERGQWLVESKVGRVFDDGGRFAGLAGFVFYTTGDLTTAGTDKQPPMSAAGKRALLAAVAGGKPFIGLHCASDTFRAPVDGQPDPFTRMLGARFTSHGEQQEASVGIVDRAFPGASFDAGGTFRIREEWYALEHVAADLRPIHVIDTAGMQGDMYRREPYPITWTRTHGRGRVFYTALGHREDVIASDRFRALIGGAIDWCRGA